MKRIVWLSLLFFVALTAKAQLKHAISIDNIIYGNVFSAPQIGVFNKENYRFVAPQFNYTVKKSKQSITFSALIFTKELYYLQNLDRDDLYTYRNISFHALYGYDMWTNKNFALTVNAGLNFGLYNHTYLLGSTPEEIYLGGGDDNAFGLVIGANPRFNVCKGLFVHSNLRYTINPLVYNKRHLNTFYIGIGMGYEFGKKNK